MNKNVLILIVVIIAGGAGIYLFNVMKKTPALREAKQYELSGDLQKALSLYGAAVFEITPSINFPDVNRSKILSPEALKKEVSKYIAWLYTPQKQVSDEYTEAMEGLARCAESGRHDNTIADTVITPLSTDQYLVEWKKSFFAPEAEFDPSHAALAAGNYARNLSLLVINSVKNYTYEINLINTSTKRGTRFLLYPENTSRFYVPPGDYLLLCRSSVTFPSEEIWRSHFTPIPLAIPSETCMITTELRTSVHRKTK